MATWGSSCSLSWSGSFLSAAHSSVLNHRRCQRCLLAMSRLNPWPRSENPPHLTTFWTATEKSRAKKPLWCGAAIEKKREYRCQLTWKRIYYISLALLERNNDKKKSMPQRVEVTVNNNFKTELWLSHAVNEAESASGAYILWCRCKADTVQWTPLYRTALLSEQQLYILARWPAILEQRKGRFLNRSYNTGRTAPKCLTGSSSLDMTSVVQYVLLHRGQIRGMFVWLWMLHHHQSRTFLFNHIVWKKECSTALTDAILTVKLILVQNRKWMHFSDRQMV